jgi:hypothetical protein
MPGFLLHLGATVICMHGGQAIPTAPNPRVLVGGQPIVTQTTTYTVAGCPFNVGVTLVPCVTAQWVTAATRVRAGGVPVLLQDSQAICAPNGTGVNILVTQVRVRGS